VPDTWPFMGLRRTQNFPTFCKEATSVTCILLHDAAGSPKLQPQYLRIQAGRYQSARQGRNICQRDLISPLAVSVLLLCECMCDHVGRANRQQGEYVLRLASKSLKLRCVPWRGGNMNGARDTRPCLLSSFLSA